MFHHLLYTRVINFYQKDYLDAPVRRITATDTPMHYAPNLVAAYLPDVPRTVNLVKEVMYLKK